MTDLENPITTITCAICLDDSIDNPITTDCSHSFCKKCFEDWLNTGTNKCPMCRKNINTYKYDDDNYKLVLIQSNTSTESTHNSIIINTTTILRRKITFYKFYIYSAFLLSIYMNYLYSKQLFINNLLRSDYQSCMANITDNTEYIDDENDHSINDHSINDHSIMENSEYNEYNEYTSVIMMMPDQSFKQCMIPEKYYMYC